MQDIVISLESAAPIGLNLVCEISDYLLLYPQESNTGPYTEEKQSRPHTLLCV
jgi:hypothetical protein